MVTFRHTTTRQILSGIVVGTQPQTGELLVERTDDGSRLYVSPLNVREIS